LREDQPAWPRAIRDEAVLGEIRGTGRHANSHTARKIGPGWRHATRCRGLL